MSDVELAGAKGAGLCCETAGIKPGQCNTEEQLYAYVREGVRASLGHQFLGVATDKASPCPGSLSNTVVSLDNNQLLLCCPSVLGGAGSTARAKL